MLWRAGGTEDANNTSITTRGLHHAREEDSKHSSGVVRISRPLREPIISEEICVFASYEIIHTPRTSSRVVDPS
ncbi:hypothetical protein AB1N83_009517 [Pleurotus pulmonarius]